MRSIRRRTALQALAAFAVAACFLGPSVAAASPGATAQLLLKFKATSGTHARSALLASEGAKQTGTVHDLGIRVLTLPASRATAALGAMRHSKLVAFAERDAIVKPQDSLPNDPSFPATYALVGGA